MTFICIYGVFYIFYITCRLFFAWQGLANKWWIKSITVTILSSVAELNMKNTQSMIPACLNTILNYTIKSSTSINSPSPLLIQGPPLTMAQGNYKNKYGNYYDLTRKMQIYIQFNQGSLFHINNIFFYHFKKENFFI